MSASLGVRQQINVQACVHVHAATVALAYIVHGVVGDGYVVQQLLVIIAMLDGLTIMFIYWCSYLLIRTRGL